MHTTTTKESLQKGLDIVSRVSTKHQTLPVLQCVLIKVDKENITLTSTNLEMGVSATIPGSVKSVGVVAVPAQVLNQTINLINQKDISLEVNNNTLTIESKGSKTEITTLNHEEFPTIPTISNTKQEIKATLLGFGIKTAAFAASQSSIKPELGSVYIHQKKEHTLTFVATDSFRLVEKTIQQQGVVLDEPIMVPFRNALEISRICDVVGGSAQMQVSENQLSLSFGEGVYITSRLTEGSFPDYQGIIPKEFTTNTTLFTADLIQALKITNIFSNTFMQVRVSLDSKNNTLNLGADNRDVGKTANTISGVVEGEDLELSFNQRYVSEPLPHFTDESVVLRFAGVGRPMVIEGASDHSLRYLVMPMNK